MPVTIDIPLQKDLAENINFNLKQNLLGDSYFQIVRGQIQTTWSLSSGHLSQSERNSFDSIFSDYNGVTEFFWTPILELGTFLVKCTSWAFEQVTSNSHILRATFEPSQEVDCQEIDLELDISNIDIYLQEAWNFINNFTRDTAPNFANSIKLPLNAFHVVEGRRNYFPSTCGTTEGIFIIANALLKYYAIAPTNIQASVLQYVLDMLDSAFTVVYRGVTPQSITNPEAQIWLPHWLYTARGQAEIKGATVEPNFLQSGYFGLSVAFTNGVGFIHADLADTYKIHTGQLLWQSVISPILNGTDYEINYWINKYNKKVTSEATVDNDTGHPIGTVVLVNTSYTGNAEAVYSLFTGNYVPNNTVMEAFPMWRACLTGINVERNHAVDVSNWAIRTYKHLVDLNLDAKWQTAFDATKFSTIQSSDVQNESYIFKIDTDTTDPLSYAGTQLIKINGKTGSLARTTSGSFIGGITVTHDASPPLNYGQLELQNFAVQAIWTRAVTCHAEFQTSVSTLLYFGCSTSEDPFDTSSMYYLPYWCVANTAYTKTFKGVNYLQWGTNTHWHPTNAEIPIYVYDGGGTAYATSTHAMQIYQGEEVCCIHLSMDNGNSWAGGGLSVIENSPRLGTFVYKLTGTVELWVKDADSKDFYQTLNGTGGWVEYTLGWSQFTAGNGTDEPNINDPITGVEFKAPNNCEMYIYYFGASPSSLPASSYVYKHTIVNRNANAMTWRVGDVRVDDSPLNILPYAPGVQPFTSNHLGTSKVSWTGSPYVGYQSPMMWYLLTLPLNAQQVVDFNKASMDSYASESPSGANWVFRQVFNWARWDAIARPPYNVFLDEGSDPNTQWEGYMHRAISECAEYWRYNPTNTNARIVTMRYINGLYTFLKGRDPDFRPPTDYIAPGLGLPQVNYTTPHGMAYILRAAVNANLAGGDRLKTMWLVITMWNALVGEYIDTGLMKGSFAQNQPDFFSTIDGQNVKEYFPFWHGEIMDTLVLLKQEKANLRYPSCDAWQNN